MTSRPAIAIIKFSALGDVLRTTALLHGLRRMSPDCVITWITSRGALDLLKNNRHIDRLLGYGQDTEDLLKKEAFDTLICLDKEEGSTALAMGLSARAKIGFGRDDSGKLCHLNKESEYAYRLGISDELKFKINKKTYQEIIYGMCSLDYKRDRYILSLDKTEIDNAARRLRKMGLREKDFVIGINAGAGDRFANKAWPVDSYISLIDTIIDRTEAKIFLLGGAREKEINEGMESLFEERVYNLGWNNSLREFAGIIKHCDIVVTGDTLAMHIGIALDRYVLALFGPTCSQEIDLYDKGVKIVSDIDCSPCYKKACARKDNCMSKIPPEKVFEEIAKRMKNEPIFRCEAI